MIIFWKDNWTTTEIYKGSWGFPRPPNTASMGGNERGPSCPQFWSFQVNQENPKEAGEGLG